MTIEEKSPNSTITIDDLKIYKEYFKEFSTNENFDEYAINFHDFNFLNQKEFEGFEYQHYFLLLDLAFKNSKDWFTFDDLKNQKTFDELHAKLYRLGKIDKRTIYYSFLQIYITSYKLNFNIF